MLEELFFKKLVAYAATQEPWMNKKTFRCVGTAYVVGRVVRRNKRTHSASIVARLPVPELCNKSECGDRTTRNR
ncbi:hypothetical protein PHMEG_0003652 [Phytophthora megakarya]|uniref:Uncharacterized protein n=1 Tax=Phytophthora megakarya TaxID=4795 RepID=A0A225WVR7_9STRA|nr:hypothetical protein PHMEG_0003652 [Phytophthora megakarya]